MKRIFGPLSASPVECTNPVRDTWRARWDYRTDPDSGATSYIEEEYDHQPTPAEVAASHRSWAGAQVDARILSGFSFEGAAVWLSPENQLNYTAAFQLATSTGGASLPVTLKFGADASPVFRTFSSLEDITAFFQAMQQHISRPLPSAVVGILFCPTVASVDAAFRRKKESFGQKHLPFEIKALSLQQIIYCHLRHKARGYE